MLKIEGNKETLSVVTKLAVPAMIESFFTSLVGFVDSFMVSALGASAVASVALTNQPRLVFVGIFSAVSVAVAALVARRYGEKRRDSANSVMLTALILAFILGVIFAVVAGMFAPDIMKLCGANSDTLEDSTLYYRIVMIGMIFNSIQFVLNAAQRGSGNTKITMITNTTANLVNVVFNYLLIGGNLGFPALGVAGAAIATVLGNAAAAIISIAFAFKNDLFVNLIYTIKEKVKPTFRTLADLTKLGYGVVLEQLLLRVGFMATAVMAADMGTNDMAVYQVIMNLLSLSFAFGDGLQQAAIALVGKSLGEKEPMKAKNYVKTCRSIGAMISLALMVLFFLTARFILGLFFDDAESINLGIKCMYVVMAILIFHIRQIVTMGALRGAGDTLYTSIAAAFSCTVVRSVLSYVFAYTCGLGIVGVYLGVLSDQISREIFSVVRFNGGKWMKIKI